MPSSSSERSSNKQRAAEGVGLSYDDVEAFLELRRRHGRPWLSWLVLFAGVCLLAESYLSASFRLSGLVLGTAFVALGAMGLNPLVRHALDLLERYIAKDPAARDKLETLDGTRFKQRLAEGKYKPQRVQ